MSNSLKNIRIARVSTIPFFVLTQLGSQLKSLVDAGAEVSIITSNDRLSKNIEYIRGGIFRPVSIAREIRLFSDLITLFKLWNMFRKEQFHIIHSTTPKAGLLCAIAAKLAGGTVCIHTYTGQPWVTMTGIKKAILKLSDKIISMLNTCCYADSFSQRDFLIKNKIVRPDRLKVLGNGSLAGVNTERFSQNNFSEEDREHLKDSLNIAPSTKVLLFVGRLSKEKGIFELFDAINTVLKLGGDIVLLVVGPFEKNSEDEIRNYAKQITHRIYFLGFQEAPERFMSISDFLCLPSYREGFGTVIIEAAAMGLPAIGTKIYGLTDAVIDGVTGLLIEPKSSSELAEAILRLISDKQLCDSLGVQAKDRAITDFDSNYCNELLIEEYGKLLNQYKRI